MSERVSDAVKEAITRVPNRLQGGDTALSSQTAGLDDIERRITAKIADMQSLAGSMRNECESYSVSLHGSMSRIQQALNELQEREALLNKREIELSQEAVAIESFRRQQASECSKLQAISNLIKVLDERRLELLQLEERLASQGIDVYFRTSLGGGNPRASLADIVLDLQRFIEHENGLLSGTSCS